jgi:polysaccharide export outer membrane protein
LAAFLAIALYACSPQAVTTTTTAHKATDPKPYIIGPDDLLDVIVWKQQQLSGKMRVEEDGTISVPLAGQVRAAGLTCQMLEKELHDKLVAFTDNPQVTVRVADPRSKVFYVVGEVNKPGVMQLRAGEVLSQGLAEAGGLTDFANRRAIRIVRREPTETIKMTINYKKVEEGDLAADVSLEPGDTITVP